MTVAAVWRRGFSLRIQKELPAPPNIASLGRSTHMSAVRRYRRSPALADASVPHAAVRDDGSVVEKAMIELDMFHVKLRR